MLKYLQIDTEGHDVVILDGLFNYLKSKESIYYPKKIKFESNEHSDQNKVTEIIFKSVGLGYRLLERGYDTVLELAWDLRFEICREFRWKYIAGWWEISEISDTAPTARL